ncbi:quinone oxidoreductase family protein [Propylenella binzhouense]|uniref:Zinc-binding alcohol dehydrogenase family protein n=1 Tax=Propylenella binzhouense TaxID=2555902 RepID=A0A964T2Q0_9HYPH|nr:zinc-binding dehydrogenase [Propylenella binzhouense]MYZ47155.1 zinc-binding alcohol dehydrogenase family protein [Propylenella binzhouense]
MKAALIGESKTPEYGDFPDPTSGETVQVCAAALTNLDIAVAEGRHYLSPKTYPFVLGMECVGQTKDGKKQFFNAMAIVSPFGSMAERTIVRPEFGLPVPSGVRDDLAAAIGNAGLAAWLPLSWRAKIRPGETVLVLGATGTSGLIAVAAARRLGAGRIVAVGRSPEALETARMLGADATVDISGGSDLTRAFQQAAGRDIDIVVDYLNGAPCEACLPLMGIGGRIVQIGARAGTSIRLPVQSVLRNSIDLMGFAYYRAPHAEQAAAYQALCNLASAGELVLPTQCLPLCDIREAWDRQKAGGSARQVIIPQ